MYIVQHRATALFDDNSPSSGAPTPFQLHLQLPPHSHSLLIFLWQLIVKVDTEVRRKSHLRAASPLPNLISLFPPRIAIPPPIPFWLLLVVLAQLCVVCCVDKKIYWHFVLFVPYPHCHSPLPLLLARLLPLGRMACKCRKLCDY